MGMIVFTVVSSPGNSKNGISYYYYSPAFSMALRGLTFLARISSINTSLTPIVVSPDLK